MTFREFLTTRSHISAAIASAFLLLATAARAGFGGDSALDAAQRDTRDAEKALSDNTPPALERPDRARLGDETAVCHRVI